jgi:multisubunit Na+/H+ antiporter MnhB subunit
MDIASLGLVAGVVQAIVFFAFLTAIIVLPRYFRSRDRDKLHETLRIAYEKGQPVPPELIAALTREDNSVGPTHTRLPTPDRDFRRGLVLVFIGLGFAAAAYALYLGIGVFSETGAWITGECVAAIGAIPGFIGLAYLVLWLAKRNSAQP